MTAAYFTLGCKLNFAETSAVGKALAEGGIRTARKGEQADICVVNTCSVTEAADKKCRQAIRRIVRQHPNAIVVVTGCYAQLKPEEVARIEGVDIVLGAEQKQDILHYIYGAQKEGGHIITSAAGDIRTFSPSCAAGDRTRYFLKVQDGCDYHCSYCTIPLARGRSRNGDIASLTAQARQAAAQGGKEIVLTGVNIGDFGRTTSERFLDLLRALDEVDGILRYRISSIEPNLLTDDIIDFTAHSRRFAPHFHIPLQSGSDAVLALMRRRYDTALFRRRVEKIRAVMPDAFIGVDVIAGMRGETEAYFADTCRFIESLPISRLHVFAYSERPGTAAPEIDHPVDAAAKQERSRLLQDVSERKLQAFYESQQGRTALVLFEHARKPSASGGDGYMFGFTGNYVKVQAPYRPDLANEAVTVRLGGWNGAQTALLAEALPDCPLPTGL